MNEVEIVVRTSDQTRGGFTSASDHARRFAGLAVGSLKLVGGAAVAAGVAAVGLGVKTASGMEQARIGFTTMLGSAQKADMFLKQLQKFAASTPFEFPELTKASQRLIAMGIKAKDVIPYMTAIGDAVAGLGGGAEQVDQVTTAIGQMSAKGKIQSDELLQLTEAGIPALQILAAQYHTTAGHMQEMVTKGKVLSDDALPKLIDGIEHGTKSTQGFGGMMEKQSHSLAGMWSTLKDNVSQALAKGIQPALPMMEKLIGWLSSALPVAIGKTVVGFQSMAHWIERNRINIANFGLTVATWGLRIVSVALDIIAGFAKLDAVILRTAGDIVEAFVKVISTVLGLLSHLPLIGGQFAKARDAVDRFGGDAVKGLRAAATGADKVSSAAATAATKARNLATNLNNIKNRNITVGILDRFTAGFRGITREINAAGNTVSVTVGLVRGPNVTKMAHGGIVGAAGGGPRSGLIWAGEQGPELVSVPYGSRVYPAGESARMAADGPAAGRVVVELKVTGGSDDLLVQWLRRQIRTGVVTV